MIGHKEITMGNGGVGDFHADEHIHPVMVLPEQSDLHHKQADGLTQGPEDLFADEGSPFLEVRLFLARFVRISLCQCHGR